MGDQSDRFPGYDGMGRAVLRRYLSGQSDDTERRRVDTWAAESAHRRAYLAAMRDLFDRAPAAAASEAAAAWTRIAAQMEPPAPSAETPYSAPWESPTVRVDVRRQGPPRLLAGAFASRRRWPGALAAAAVLIAAIGGALLLRSNPHPAVSVPASGMRQVATAKGQRAEIQLGDGSRVVLGVASRLRFLPTLGSDRGSRDVYLEGAAYFDVVHDSTRRFLVHTTNGIAEDIGTQFVVTAYPETGSTEVVVAEGAVALGRTETSASAGAARVLVTRGHLGRLIARDSVPSVRAVDPALYSAWTHGELVFHDTPLADAVAELRRWYDVDLRLGDESALGHVPVTASFVAESFNDALAVITTVLPIRAVRHGKTVSLFASRPLERRK